MYFFRFNFRSHASFKRQLLSFFIISVAILAIVTSIITAWQTSQLVRQSTINTGLQLTGNFADQSLLALLTDSVENSKEVIDSTMGFESVSAVAIFKLDGNLLVASSGVSEKTFYAHFSNWFKSDQNKDTVHLLRELDERWLFSAPVIYVVDDFDSEIVDPEGETQQSEVLGYVLVEFNKNELHQIQQSIFINNLLIGSLVTILLALFMGWGINRLIGPLIELSQTMRTASDVKYYPRAQITGAAEIRQMAEAYNQMMTSLELQNTELEKHRDTLESEVEMRTQELLVARDTALTASRHKSEFLANISHELRTPLQAIIGYTDLVKEDLELECMDVQVEDLNKSIRSAHNLLELINNILDIAKIEAGRMDLYLKPVDMTSLIDETLETVAPMAAANKNEIVVERESLALSLVLDRQKLMQIFLNLLSNACKFTKQGTITFTISSDTYFLYFSVVDTGLGIPQDQLKAIFEQFTQVDGSQTRKFEGTGLGMAITQNFCEIMGGEIQVESEVGVGSKFSVKLPLKVLS